MSHTSRYILRLLFAVLFLHSAWPALASSSTTFTVNAGGTVSDSATGLMWDQCTWGQSGSACATGSASPINWPVALGAVVSANAQSGGTGYKSHNDWRLPNIAELESLVDISATYPAIDPTTFPNTKSDNNTFYWSSTYSVSTPGNTWNITFTNGLPGLSTVAGNPGGSYYVRLVRSGRAADSYDRTPSNVAPTAVVAAITGTATVGQTLVGSYTYADTESNPESGSTYQWYRQSDTSGTGRAAISGASGTVASAGTIPGYTLTIADGGQYLVVGVVPKASAGSSPGTEAFSAATAQVPAVAPGAPGGVTPTVGNGQVSVAFSAPTTGGSAITGYAVACSSSDGGAAGNNTGTSSPIVVIGLTDGKTYTCTVTASNTVGAGTASSASSAVTLPTPIVVINTNDSGAGSLRQAIADTLSGGTILFDSSIANGTLTLASTLTIDKSLTIDGGTQKITVSGNNAVRVFNTGSGLSVTLKQMTIANGNDATNGGGGIYNGSSTLVLSGVTLSNNTDSGAGGGGLYNASGTVTISNSTFSGNSAASGGALRTSGGTLNLANVTFSGNSATGAGGGAIFATSSGIINIDNVTISGNTAGTGNGSGISNQGATINLSNTLLSSNSGGNCSNAASITNVGYNLDDGTSCGFTSANYSLSSTDPKLAVLADNGGFTQTRALLTGSPAINAGNNATCASTDQRGVTRPLTSVNACDIGAFEAVSYSVTFNSNSGSSVSSQSVAYNGTATVPTAPTKTGYTFAGWYTDSGLTASFVFSTAITADLTLYAQWTALPNHSVTFNANGGAGSMSAQVANVATNLTANSFTKAGYTFSGWNSVALGTGTAYADSASYAFVADVTLYAQWTALASHTVTFASNGGAGSMSAQVANVATNLTANSFSKAGYTFSGWNTVALGTGTAYADSASYAFVADVTLYAQWTALASHTVTFASNGGAGSMSAQVANVATNLTANSFTKAGYTFSGWNTVAGGTGTSYANSASYAFAADVTLYAQWTALPNKTVTFSSNGGTGSMTAQSTNVATNLTANSFTRSGYTFSGWNTVAAGGGTAYADSASYAFTANVTLYAQWTANSYTVSFNPNGGSAVSSQSVIYNGTATAPTAPTKTGSTFAGWYSDSGLTTAFNFATLITANTTLYAQWTPATYSVTPSPGTHGSLSPATAQSVAYGNTTSFTVTPATGYGIATATGCNGGLSGNTYTTGPMVANCQVNVTFSANRVDGACGSDNGQTLSTTPSQLCTTGTASLVYGRGPWNWTCAGSNGGSIASCSAAANSHSVTASAGTGGSISPSGRTVAHNGVTTFTVAPSGGYKTNTVSGCSGGLSGTLYTTGAVTTDCAVAASFTATNTTTAIGTVSPSPSKVGQSVTIAYSVSNAGSGSDTVTVKDSAGNTLCTGTVSASTCSAIFTSSGAKTLIAHYTPSGTAQASDSPGYNHLVADRPSLATPTLPSGVVGVPYATMLVASGGVPPYSFTATGLPAGFSLSSSGLLSGTASAATAPTVRLTVTDHLAQSADQDYPLSLVAQLTVATTSLPDGLVNAPYDQTLQAVGGKTPYAWSVISGALPGGLTLNPATGQLSGTPSNLGTSAPFTVQAQDANARTATQVLSLTTQPPTVTKTGSGSNSGTTLSANLTPSNGGGTCTLDDAQTRVVTLADIGASSAPPNSTLPYGLFKMTVQGCTPGQTQLSVKLVYPAALPPGTQYWKYGKTAATPSDHWYVLPSAVITGNTVSFSITDGGLGDDDLTADGSITDPGAAGSPTLAISGTPGSGQVGSAYSSPLSASNGTGPYHWSIASGDLPNGVVLGASTGQLSGTPTQAGTFNFTVQLVDTFNSQNASTTRGFSITMADTPPSNTPPSASSVSLAGNAQVGQTLTGSYTYGDTENDPEGVSTFQWYADSTPSGHTKVALSGATANTTTVQGSDLGQVLFFCVTPRASSGALTGSEACSNASAPVSAAWIAALMTSGPPPNGTVGTPYRFTVTASGTAPITFSASGLPPGLSLDASSGLLSGTPSTAGSYPVTLSASNAQAPGRVQSVSHGVSAPVLKDAQVYPIVIEPVVAVAPVSIPTLSEWGMLLLSGLMALFGFGQRRRRLP